MQGETTARMHQDKCRACRHRSRLQFGCTGSPKVLIDSYRFLFFLGAGVIIPHEPELLRDLAASVPWPWVCSQRCASARRQTDTPPKPQHPSGRGRERALGELEAIL